MKKTFAVILIAALAINMTGAVVSAAEKADGVSISCGESYTAPVFASSPSTVEGFEKLVAESKKSSAKASDLIRLASFQLRYGQDKADERTVYRSADGALYINQAKNLRSIDADGFYRLVDEADRGFYKFRPVPSATVEGVTLPVLKSGYSFMKLDGKFYKTQFAPGTVPRITLKDDKPAVPVFSSGAKNVRISIIDLDSKQTLLSCTPAGLPDFTPSKTGAYRVEITASFDSDYTKGNVTYAYTFSHNADISFSVDGAGTNPGEVVILRGKNIPEGSTIIAETDIAYKPVFFRRDNGDMIAFLPVSYYTAPGQHYINLECNGQVSRFAITAGDKKFVVQNLTVPPSTAQETINSQKANDEYEKHIAPIRFAADPQQYWSGRFTWPLKVDLRVTTQFGTIRYTNGGKTPSRHGAIDFAAAAGTPVYASGAGRVLFAGFLQLTGNTVVIEHGYGLKTWHYHMNSLNVKTGDMVKQEQKIGEVGSTGFSTGAHLHFGMSVNNVYVNPETAVKTDLFADK